MILSDPFTSEGYEWIEFLTHRSTDHFFCCDRKTRMVKQLPSDSLFSDNEGEYRRENPAVSPGDVFIHIGALIMTAFSFHGCRACIHGDLRRLEWNEYQFTTLEKSIVARLGDDWWPGFYRVGALSPTGERRILWRNSSSRLRW
jgi:hypothetical protein